MYRRLTNSILFCRLTHRCIVVYDISCNFHCPFLDITFHENSPHSLLFYNLCGEFLMYVCIILANDYLPQHFLYFLPEPQGQGLFLPIFGSVPTYGVCISSPFIEFQASPSSAPTNISESSATYFLCQRDSSYEA